MEINARSLTQFTPFSSLTEAQTEELLGLFSPRRAEYGKGEYLFGTPPARSLGVIVSGCVSLFSDDLHGDRDLIAQLTAGDTLGTFAGSARTAWISAAAEEKTCVLWFSSRVFASPAAAQKPWYGAFALGIAESFARRERLLAEKIAHMGRRTTRRKLLSYLASQATEKGTNEFDIPLSRQQLADYLAVDRSAMSAELSALEREGYLRRNRAHFVLLRLRET